MKVRILSALLLTLSLSLPVQAAPDYTNLQGDKVQLSDYSGQYLLVNYWATWCPPCVKEMPSMQRLHDALKDQAFSVVAVNIGQSAEQVEKFRAGLPVKLTFPLLLDEKSESFAAMKLIGLPTTYLLGPEGERLQTYTGGREWDSPEQIAQLRELIKAD